MQMLDRDIEGSRGGQSILGFYSFMGLTLMPGWYAS